MTEECSEYSNGYIDERFRRVWDRFESVQRAVEKAEASINERMAGQNEFRSTLSDLSKGMATKAEMSTLEDMLMARIWVLDTFKTTEETRREEYKKSLDAKFRTFGVLVVIVQVAMALVTFFLSHRP